VVGIVPQEMGMQPHPLTKFFRQKWLDFEKFGPNLGKIKANFICGKNLSL